MSGSKDPTLATESTTFCADEMKPQGRNPIELAKREERGVSYEQ
jgi:hypothetical protein